MNPADSAVNSGSTDWNSIAANVSSTLAIVLGMVALEIR
jgi:hypothetical protein